LETKFNVLDIQQPAYANFRVKRVEHEIGADILRLGF